SLLRQNTMLKIKKGIKKKIKGKKDKNDELFTPEELEKYKREKEEEAKRLAEQQEQQLQETNEEKENVPLEGAAQPEQEDTAGPSSEVKETSDGEKKEDWRSPTASGKNWVDLERGGIDDEPEPEAEEVKKPEEAEPEPEPELAPLQFIEDLPDVDVDDFTEVFDTTYVDNVESGEVKLHYIPDSPTTEDPNEPDPFDTSVVDKVLNTEEAESKSKVEQKQQPEKKKKKLVSLGCAVDVLTGKLQTAEKPSGAPQPDAKRRRVITKEVNLLGGDVEVVDDVTTEEGEKEKEEREKKSVAKAKDKEFEELEDDPFDTSAAAQVLEPEDTADAEKDPFDISFAEGAIESESSSVKPSKPPPPRPAPPTAQPEANEIDPFDTSVADHILPVDHLASPDTALDLPDTLQPQSGADITKSESFDPFDTSIAESFGKTELKVLETELLTTEQNLKEEEDDFDFDPRAGEPEKTAPARPPQPCLLTADEEEVASGPVLTPAQDIQDDFDPFDTSIAAKVVIKSLEEELLSDTAHQADRFGKTELRTLESELLADSGVKRNLSDDEFDPREEESKAPKRPPPPPQAQKPPTPINLLDAPEDYNITEQPIQASQPQSNTEELDDYDPFDTTIAENIGPKQDLFGSPAVPETVAASIHHPQPDPPAAHHPPVPPARPQPPAQSVPIVDLMSDGPAITDDVSTAPGRPPPPRPPPPSKETKDLLQTVIGAMEATTDTLHEKLNTTRTPCPSPGDGAANSPSPTPDIQVTAPEKESDSFSAIFGQTIEISDQEIDEPKNIANSAQAANPTALPATGKEAQPAAPGSVKVATDEEFDAFSARFDNVASEGADDLNVDPFASSGRAASPWGEASSGGGGADAFGFGDSAPFDSFLAMNEPPPPPQSTPRKAPRQTSADSVDEPIAVVIKPAVLEVSGSSPRTVSPVPVLAPPPAVAANAAFTDTAPRFNPFDRGGDITEVTTDVVAHPGGELQRTDSQETPPTPLFEEDQSQPLEQFPRIESSGQIWEMHLRQPNKKKITGQRFWKKVYVKLTDGGTLQLFNSKDDKDPFQELPLQACYSVSDIGAQQFDQFGKIFTVKVQYIFYKERPGVRPGQLSKAERLTTKLSKFAQHAIAGDYEHVKEFASDVRKLGMPVEHAPQISQLLKLGTQNYEDLKVFSSLVEEQLFSLTVHRDRALNYKSEEVQLTAVDEIYVEQDLKGIVHRMIARVRIFFLGFLSGMPDVDLGINDMRKQGREVVGRHDIIPVITEEWIRLEAVEFHCCVNKDDFEKTQHIKFKPPDACYIELMRFRVRPPKNRELPLQIKTKITIQGRRVDIFCDILVPGFSGRKLGQVPCEDIMVRFPLPECWIYLFRVEKHFRYGSVKSAHRRQGKVKGIERLKGAVETAESALMEVTSGQAKYEHQHRAVVWRMARLPKEGQGAYTNHTFSCRMNLTAYDQMPESLDKYCYVEFTMPATTVSHCVMRSVSITTEEPPEKYVRYLARHEYRIEMEFSSGTGPSDYIAATMKTAEQQQKEEVARKQQEQQQQQGNESSSDDSS
ncbi:hypothetical protein SK128_012436, partial [Halocaridina rubra]